MASTTRRFDRKLDAILAGRYTPRDFIIADAKDADMAFGLAAPWLRPGATVGPSAPGRYATRATYLDDMRALVQQGELDILLTSASNGEVLSLDGSLDEDITLAVRGNDSTDVWTARRSTYNTFPSVPFRTASLSAIRGFCDLVLYSVTFNNDVERDLASLVAYGEFRREAAEQGVRHFLEVFNPNAKTGLPDSEIGAFVNDSIIRTLAGVTQAERPLFLKMAYNGGASLSELAEHDPTLVVGILGGSAGTTRDTFELLHRSESAGGRVALFGRKIQRAESQLDLVALIRPVIEGRLTPADAVRAYHEALGERGLASTRTLEADLEVTDPVLLSE
jgi:hypothetical protein